MPRLGKCPITVSIFSLLVFALSLLPAQATPFFARAYGFKCQHCHSGFPRLNEFGLAFKANNFRIPGAEKDAPLLWQKTIPLAAQVKPTSQRFSPGSGKFDFTDTQLLAGGLLGRRTAVYLHHTYLFDALPQPFPSWEFWAQHVLDEKNHIQLKGGQFELPYAYSPEANRTTISTPGLFFGGFMGNDVSLGGTMSGLQLSGIAPGGLHWFLAHGAPAAPQSGNVNGERAFFGRFRDTFARIAMGAPERHAGAFAYLMRPPRDPNTVTSETRGVRFGLDGTYFWRGYQVQGMAIYGENSDPKGTGVKGILQGGFVEVDRMITPWLGLTGRLEAQTLRIGASRSYGDAKTISLRIYPYEKVKLIAEYQKQDHGRSTTSLGAAISIW